MRSFSKQIFKVTALLWVGSASAQSADEVLKKADEIRAPSESYQMEVSVDSSDGSKFRYEIRVGGKESSLIRTLEPKGEVGKNFLMLHEDMWAFIPNIKRSRRVTLNQKLSGQAANGDISRMSWVGDYKPLIESESPTNWVLLLKAERKGLTYDGIRVWIDKSNFRPIKGEYLSVQGKVLKLVEFSEFTTMAGALRPSRILIKQASNPEEFSELRIINMKKQSFPSADFTESNLNKL